MNSMFPMAVPLKYYYIVICSGCLCTGYTNHCNVAEILIIFLWRITLPAIRFGMNFCPFTELTGPTEEMDLKALFWMDWCPDQDSNLGPSA